MLSAKELSLRYSTRSSAAYKDDQLSASQLRARYAPGEYDALLMEEYYQIPDPKDLSSVAQEQTAHWLPDASQDDALSYESFESVHASDIEGKDEEAGGQHYGVKAAEPVPPPPLEDELDLESPSPSVAGQSQSQILPSMTASWFGWGKYLSEGRKSTVLETELDDINTRELDVRVELLNAEDFEKELQSPTNSPSRGLMQSLIELERLDQIEMEASMHAEQMERSFDGHGDVDVFASRNPIESTGEANDIVDTTDIALQRLDLTKSSDGVWYNDKKVRVLPYYVGIPYSAGPGAHVPPESVAPRNVPEADISMRIVIREANVEIRIFGGDDFLVGEMTMQMPTASASRQKHLHQASDCRNNCQGPQIYSPRF